MSGFTEALQAAQSDGEALGAIAAALADGGEVEAPAPEALAGWWPAIPGEARADATKRQRQLARHLDPGAADRARFEVLDGRLLAWLPAGPPVDRLTATLDGPGIALESGEGLAMTDAALMVARRPLGLSRAWLQARADGFTGPHPLAPVVKAWRDRPRDPSRRHLIVTRERRPPKGREPLHLARAPGLLHLASLAAVEVDGEPFATVQPDGTEVRMKRYRPRPEPVPDLFGEVIHPHPRTLAGAATAGALVEAVADLALDGDERSPIRADILKLGTMAYALTGAARLTDAEGAVLVGGRDSPANRKRFNRALWGLRWLGIEAKPGIRWALADAEPGDVNRIGPPGWWLNYWRLHDRMAADGLKPRQRRAALEKAGFDGRPLAYRLTGGLFRLATKWGALERTIGGLEGALLWGSSPGRGKRGRIPDNLRPVRPGGPGPELFIPAWQLLRLAGEHVGPDNWTRIAQNRFNARCADLERSGYFTGRDGTATAGDTVEVVERQRPGPGRPAGLVIRASARWCAAYATGERVRLPASRLLGGL